MKQTSQIRSGRHYVFEGHAHLVLVTKYQRQVFPREILGDMPTLMDSVCKRFEPTWTKFGGESDHVHLLVNDPPNGRPLAACEQPKRYCVSMDLKKNTRALKKPYGAAACGLPYFAGSFGGAPIDIVRKDIENQKRPN